MQTIFYFLKKHLGHLRSTIGIATSGLLLWLMISQSQLQWQQLKLNPQGWLYFILATMIFLLTLMLHALRVRQMWFLQHPTQAFRSLVIGNFYNCLLPGNLGEGMRAWHFSRKNNVPISRSFSNIILEKILDAQTYIVVAIIWYIPYGFRLHSFNYTIATVCLIVIVYSIFWFLWLRHIRYARQIIGLLPTKKLRKEIYRLYRYFAGQLNDILAHGTLLKYVTIGYGMFLLNAIQYIIIMKAVGLPTELITFGNGYFVALCMVIIMFIPSAPGNTGVMHYGLYAVMLFLAQHQIPYAENPVLLKQYALFAIFVHLSCITPEIITGAIYLWVERRNVF